VLRDCVINWLGAVNLLSTLVANNHTRLLQHGATKTIQNTRRKGDGCSDLSNEILSKVSTSFLSTERYWSSCRLLCSISAIERKLDSSSRQKGTGERALTGRRGLLCMLGLLVTNYHSELLTHRSSIAPPCALENQMVTDTSPPVLYVLIPLLRSISWLPAVIPLDNRSAGPSRAVLATNGLMLMLHRTLSQTQPSRSIVRWKKS